MTPTYSTTGRQRPLLVPSGFTPSGFVSSGFAPGDVTPSGFVPSDVAPSSFVPSGFQDPPIYADLLRTWTNRGRTLPGRHDPEWVRLVAPVVRPGQFSGSPDRRGDGR
ncbi:hypothetical protein [Streptomyces sp. MN13]